jgi:hypothetical protein
MYGYVLIALIIEAVIFPGTSVSIHQTVQHGVLAGNHLDIFIDLRACGEK